MTLPTSNPLNGDDDDSDMFGPPRSSPVGYHQRSRVPMISPKLRQREERKRILQLCAHKLERIKDSETNLRRSVCINNTYSRLNDEVRREKQSRYVVNQPKMDTKPETAHDNIYSPYQHNYSNQMELRNENYHKLNQQESFNNNSNFINNKNSTNKSIASSSLTNASSVFSSSSNSLTGSSSSSKGSDSGGGGLHHLSTTSISDHHNCYSSKPISLTTTPSSSSCSSYASTSQTTALTSLLSSTSSTSSTICSTTISSSRSFTKSANSVDADLESLDRELNAINASMPLIDPEITQGAEQLEKAVSSRKRSRTEEENDRLVREALSQFYLPTQRLISAIDDYQPELKRTKLSSHHSCSSMLTSSGHMISTMSTTAATATIGDLDLDLALDISHHQSQNGFDVIMDALRLSASSPTPSAQDSCGQAAMMSESGVFHNLVVTSLET